MENGLNWQTVRVVAGMPVRISIAGNVDTRVATRFFWLPLTDDVSQRTWDEGDGQELSFDPAAVKPGQQNHLGFSCVAAPVVRQETSLFVNLTIRQADTLLLEKGYPLDVSEPNAAVRLSDGITFAI